MKTRAIIATAAGAGLALCLFPGSMLLHRSAPDHPAGPGLPPASANAAVASTSGTNASASVPAIPILHRGPDGTGAPGTVEDIPASVPTGDYELNLTAGQISAMVERRYGGLFPALELPPERLARLRTLLAERQQAAVDAANSALLTGLNPIRDLPTIRRAIELAQVDLDDTLRNELGTAVFTACTEHDRTLPERNTVSDFARRLAKAREPLRPEQADRLMKILQDPSGTDSPPDMDRAIFGAINTRAPVSDRSVAAAANVLSPRQLEQFRELQQTATPENVRP